MSKIILMEKNISAILKTIAKGSSLYNIVADRIIGYNFKADYENFIATRSIEYIEQDKNLIPFVFCLLNEIDNGNINAYSFIKAVYGEDNKVAYDKFCMDFIDKLQANMVGVVNKICNIDLTDELTKNAELKNEFPMFDSMFVSRIKYVVESIMESFSSRKCDKFKSKKDASTIGFSILVCLDRQEFSGVLGLILGLKSLLTENRFFKNDVKELELLINSIINF